MKIFKFALFPLAFYATTWAQSRWGTDEEDDDNSTEDFESADQVDLEEADQLIIEENEEDKYDLEQDEYVVPGDNYNDIYLFEDDPEMVPENMFEAILQDMNECGLNIIYKYDIQDEVKYFFDEIQKPEYFEMLETGTHEEIIQYLSLIIDPLVIKVFEASGDQVA